MASQPLQGRLAIAALTGAVLCAALAGCACLRCPRIDPSGERLLIWPKDEVAVAPAAIVPGNIQAPPAVTDPVFPAAPAGAVVAPATSPLGQQVVANLPTDSVIITPQRILAPVGSEVVLKASLCTTEGYTLADQKVEWMLGREGVGQFVEASGTGLFHPAWLPWNKSKKLDSYYAVGYTASDSRCLDRGTPDPTDDVDILRGDAWISVTSPNEGASYVTAYIPAVESWNQRRANATIYWVDVQWTFPPGSIAGSGRSEVLTTTVTRQTDGTPIEGWIVRYEVNDGSRLSGGTGQVVEVRTGADGRAAVEVSPTAVGAPSSRIDMQLIRPAGTGAGDAPRLVIANSSTIIQWGGSTPYLNTSPPVSQPVTPTPSLGGLPTTPMTPMTPPTTIPGPTGQPAPGQTTIPAVPAGRPNLQVEVRAQSQEAQVGGTASFDVVLTNTGSAPATGIFLNVQYQEGLSHPAERESVRQIEYPAAAGDVRRADETVTLGPGQSRTIALTFNVVRPGRWCHDVTVNSAEASPIPRRTCVTCVETAPQRVGRISVSKDGPPTGVQDQMVTFTVTVKNTGELPLTNIELFDEYPPALLEPRPAEPNVQAVSGVIRRTIQRLEVGATRTFEVPCVCLRAARPVLPAPLARVTATTDPPTSQISSADDHSLEILPPGSGATAGGAGQLRLGVTFFPDRPRAGTRTTCQVTLVNAAAADDENVQLRIILPAQLTPDLSAIQGPPGVQHRQAGNELQFTGMATLRSQERVQYVIPMNAIQSGVVEVAVQAISRRMPDGVAQRVSLEIPGL